MESEGNVTLVANASRNAGNQEPGEGIPSGKGEPEANHGWVSAAVIIGVLVVIAAIFTGFLLYRKERYTRTARFLPPENGLEDTEDNNEEESDNSI